MTTAELLFELTQRQDVTKITIETPTILVPTGRVEVTDDQGDASSVRLDEDGLISITRWLNAGPRVKDMHDGLR